MRLSITKAEQAILLDLLSTKMSALEADIEYLSPHDLNARKAIHAIVRDLDGDDNTDVPEAQEPDRDAFEADGLPDRDQ